MSGIATAIISAAVITGVAVDVAGQKAASATKAGATTAANVQMAALQQQAQLAAPYTGLGQAAMPTYQALLGIGPSGGAGIQKTLENLPGYQFTKQQGIGATEAAASALYGGGRGGGNLLQGIDQYTTGLAQQNYQQYLQDLLQPIQIGQAAAAGQAANIQAGATNLGNIATNQGNTLAGIQANEIAGITRAAGGGVNNYLTYQTLQNLQNNPNNPGYWGGSTPYDPGQTGGAGYPGAGGYNPAVDPGLIYPG